MSEETLPAWLRDARRYVHAVQRDEALRQKRESELVATIARMTEENLALGGKQPGTRTCRVCGCTDLRACVKNGVPCSWVEKDLCSACENAELELKETRELAGEGAKNWREISKGA